MGTERVEPGANGRVAAETTPEQDGAVAWKGSGQYEDIVYETGEGIAKITINRPGRHNAFRRTRLFKFGDAFDIAQKDSKGAVTEGAAGMRRFAGDATLPHYMSAGAWEGRDAFKEKRAPDSGRFPRRP